MTGTDYLRHISDTARWVAMYRARESERPDALFNDPFARKLAGIEGERIVDMLMPDERNAWAFVVRTHVIDRLVAAEIAAGTDLVVNLAAGLDTRPYRLELPAGLRWVEVDLPGILDHKETLLRDARPRCALERVRLDLGDRDARRALFARLASEARRILVLTEGLLIYLTDSEVGTLAKDLAESASFTRWIVDIASPPLLAMLRKDVGKHLDAAGSTLRFAPANGPDFFTAYGWRPLAVHSALKEAARLKRLPFMMRIIALLPEPDPPQKRPWSGIVLLGRTASGEMAAAA